MKIIISPAKNMRPEEYVPHETMPVFLERAERIRQYLQSMDLPALQKLWGCNEKLAKLNFERVQAMNLRENLSPAVLAYDGIQYKYMAPNVFTADELAWLSGHLRILSGFYGILRPMDGVVPYRLEMRAAAAVDGASDLYDFWGEGLYRELTCDGSAILNLASGEYADCIRPYLKSGDTFIDVVFAERSGEKLVQKGTLAKMARGRMVRFLAEQGAETPETAKAFDALGYTFSDEHSTDNKFVFIKE